MHVCFLDIDGTLISTGGAGQAAFVVTLAKDFGVADASSAGVAFAGRSDRAISMDLFARHGMELSAADWERFAAAYVCRLDEVLPAYRGRVLPGVVALLERLAARGDVALGLLTGNLREAARRKLIHYGLWGRFAFGGFGDDHLDRNDVATAALADARRHLNGSPAGRIVVIGDTVNDVRCGRSIGARCVAVPTGSTPREDLQSAQPDLLVETLEDVAPILAMFD